MKYEEQPGPENFRRFERLATAVISVSQATLKKRLAEEQRRKPKRNKKKKKEKARG